MLKYLPDYQMNLLQVNEIEELEQYQSGLREFFGILSCRKDGEELRKYMERNRERLSNLDKETYQEIREVAEMDLGETKEKEEGGRNMFEALEQLMQKSKAEGFKCGEAFGIQKGEIKGILATMKEFGSSKEKAIERLLQRFPDDKDLILQIADQIFPER